MAVRDSREMKIRNSPESSQLTIFKQFSNTTAIPGGYTARKAAERRPARWNDGALSGKAAVPRRGLGCLAVLLGGSSRCADLSGFGDDSPFAYVSYLLSAYALTVFAAASVPLLSCVRRLTHRVPLAHQYLTDRYFKVRSGSLLSFFVNLCYVGSSWPARCGTPPFRTARWRSITSCCARRGRT